MPTQAEDGSWPSPGQPSDSSHRGGATEPLPSAEVPLTRTLVAPEPSAHSAGDTMPATPGDRPEVRVPGYEVIEELGRGGMGVVYLARQVKANRRVALKMILAGSHAGTADLTRFQTEAESVARLQHPNIVQVHDVGEHAGLPFFSLEFCAGGSLEKQLRQRPLEPSVAATLVEALARAMQHAHEHQVIHRDLKPANVLLAEDGTPKIADFGLAKKLDEAGQTASGSVMGTPSYMAPEQAQGKAESLGPLVDVYALGAILYDCVCGRPPFRAATALDTLMQVVHEEPVSPRRLNPKVPLDLETICLKCLRKDAARRYGSAAELADDLKRFLAGEPIAARPVGRLERGWRWCKRNPGLAATGFLAALALVAVAVVSVLYGIEQAHMAERESEAAEVLRREEENTRKHMMHSRRLSARFMWERGQALGDHGDAPGQLDGQRGLLWLARALETAPEEDADLVRGIRMSLAAWHDEVGALAGQFNVGSSTFMVRFGPANKTFLTVTTGQRGNHEVCRWDAQTGEQLLRRDLTEDGVRVLALHPDGKRVLTESRMVMRLWDADAGAFRGEPMRARVRVTRAAFTLDGATLVAAADDRDARLWDVTTGKTIGPALQPEGLVRAVAFSPDGKMVAIGNQDGTVRLWDARTGASLNKTIRSRADIRALAFKQDDRTLAIAGSGVVLWDVDHMQEVGELTGHLSLVLWVAFGSPGSGLILTTSADRTARLWSFQTKQQVGSALWHPASVPAGTFSPDGRYVLTRCSDGMARLWRLPHRSARQVGAAVHHQAAVTAVAYRPDGGAFATGGGDGTVRLWDAATSKELREPLRLVVGVRALAFGPDGKSILVAGGRMAQVWDIMSGQPVGPPITEAHVIQGAVFCADGKTILVGGEKGRVNRERFVRRYEVRSGKLLWDFPESRDGCNSLAITREGRFVLVGGWQKAEVWDLESKQLVQGGLDHNRTVTAAAFSPDGAKLITGSDDYTAQLWDTRTGRPLGRPLGMGKEIEGVAFSPDGKLVATVGMDRTARLWDVETSLPLGPAHRHPVPVLSVAFDPGGTRILTGCRDMWARRWVVPAPADVPIDRVGLWASVQTGMEMDADGVIRPLDAGAWRDARRRLETLGGPMP